MPRDLSIDFSDKNIRGYQNSRSGQQLNQTQDVGQRTRAMSSQQDVMNHTQMNLGGKKSIADPIEFWALDGQTD